MTAKKRSRLLAAILMACVALTACTPGTSSNTDKPARPSTPNLNAYSDTQARRDYQIALNRSPHRIASNVPVITDGHLFIAEQKGVTEKFAQECTGRCATAIKVNDGYEVVLPIGFNHRKDDYQLTDPKRYVSVPVVKLTYWDPVTHKPAAIVPSALKVVPFPKVLTYRKLTDMKNGDEGFLNDDEIFNTPKGLRVLDWAEAPREPNTPLYDGNNTFTVPVFKRGDEIVVCAPSTWAPAHYTNNPAYHKNTVLVSTTSTC